MKICSNCAFKVLDNQKFCPKCGLPVDSKMLENTSKEIISDSKKQKSEKQESEKQSNLNIPDNKKKKHINKSIIMITIIAITIIVLGGFIVKSIILNQDNSHDEVEPYDEVVEPEYTEEDEYSKLKDIITYVKNEFASIMKIEDIVFIKFDESNNRYLFESSYECSQVQYYYYPETGEITITVPGSEVIINQNFSFKTTFGGEPSDEDYHWRSSLLERILYKEVLKVNESIDNIAKNKFSDMLDYAISPYLEYQIDGIEFYLVRVNEGEPNYEVYEFLLGSDGKIYDYWEMESNNKLIEIF